MISKLTKEQMQTLTTKRLLAYKNKLMQCHDGPNWDFDKYNDFDKSSPEWQEIYTNLKEVLSTRENVK